MALSLSELIAEFLHKLHHEHAESCHPMTLVYARWELSLQSLITRAQGSCSDHLCGDLKHRVAQLSHDGAEAAHSHRAESPRQSAHCIGRRQASPHLDGWNSMLTMSTSSQYLATTLVLALRCVRMCRWRS